MIPNKKEYTQFDILGTEYTLPLVNSGSKTKEHILMEATILFAKTGYHAVSMRDLAEVIGIKPASLYNHFPGKEALWEAVLEHTIDLYMLYFKQVDEMLGKARSLAEVLEVMFSELKKLRNLFTCYAFSLIQAEQFRDPRCGHFFNGTFLEYSIDFVQRWFDKCVEQKMAPPFDTKMVSNIFMHCVLIGLNVKVHQTLGRPTPYEPGEMFVDLQDFLYRSITGTAKASNQGAAEDCDFSE